MSPGDPHCTVLEIVERHAGLHGSAQDRGPVRCPSPMITTSGGAVAVPLTIGTPFFRSLGSAGRAAGVTVNQVDRICAAMQRVENVDLEHHPFRIGVLCQRVEARAFGGGQHLVAVAVIREAQSRGLGRRADLVEHLCASQRVVARELLLSAQ